MDSLFMLEASNTRPAILLVDDEPEIINVLRDLLSENYECSSAGSAEEALALLLNQSFHLVISDITMMGMSGLEMVPHVLEVSPQTVVVLVSGAQTIESAIEALRVGAFDYIMKPFDLRQVEAVVKRALEHYDLRVAKRHYENQLEELVEQRTAELDDALDSLGDAYRTTLKALAAALETRDHETHGHSQRVVSFSLRLGYELGLDKEQLMSLEFGSLLHDIGKIGVPDAILRKPAALDEDEWIKMRQHPLHGQQILRGIEFLEGAARVVAQHHEKWDGSGYPLGLKGEDIDLNARIFAVADAFDALTSDRVYRAAQSYEAASTELDRCINQHFDQKIVEAFHRVPKEEWEALRRAPVLKIETKSVLKRQPWAMTLESRLGVIAS
ncbi:MAG TPA: HD domain-containing phosphohydrolase [Pyrinomonadaceae bacterium]|nr:HD domain-containing phosphohydrolase [Pyrinomonadaceae bacterium]